MYVSAPAATGVAATDTANLQSTITNNRLVYIPAGNYVINATITIPANTDIMGAGRGLAIINSSAVASLSAAFAAQGTEGSTSNLSANVVEQAVTATVVNGALFAAGNWVRLHSNKASGTDGALVGEFLLIASVSGNVLTFQNYIQGTYNTVDTARITLVTGFVGGIRLHGLGFVGSTNNTIYCTGISLDHCIDAMIQDCSLSYYAGRGVENYHSIGTRVEECYFEFMMDDTASLGYAISHDGATCDAVVSGCRFNLVKTAVDHTGSTTAGNGGVPRRCVFSNNTVLNAYRGGCQAHTGAEDLVFTNNTISSVISDPLIGQADAFNIWGTRMIVANNTITSVARRAIYAGNGTYAPFRLVVANNIMRMMSLNVNYGRGLELPMTSTGGGAVESIVITGNQIKMSGTNSYSVIDIVGGSGTTRSDGVVITGNDLDSPSDYGAIRATFMRDFVISGNHCEVYGTSVNSAGIEVDDSLDGTIHGNTIRGGGTGGLSSGVLASNTSNVACSCNRVRAFNTGIKTTGTSTAWNAAANVLSGNTTATSLVGANTTTGANS